MHLPKSKQPDWWGEIKARIEADCDWYAKYAVAEAARGNPYPLIGLIHSYPISSVEIKSITAALKDTASKDTKGYLRRFEQELIARAVDHMVDDDKVPLTQKQAIEKVSEVRGRSVSHIKAAVAAYGKKRYYPR